MKVVIGIIRLNGYCQLFIYCLSRRERAQGTGAPESSYTQKKRHSITRKEPSEFS